MKRTFINGFIFSFFFGVISLSTSAQEYKYDISKYYTPDIVRNQLDLSFNTNNNLSNYRDKNDSTQSSPSHTSRIEGALSPNFTSYTNTRKRLTLFQLNGMLNGYNTGNGNGNYSEQDLYTNDNVNINYSSYFYNSFNHFFSLGLASSFQTSITKNKTSIAKNTYNNNTSISTNNSESYGLNFSPSIGMGLGRVESVEDARQALYILEDLSKKGVLTRHLNNDEIFQFAQQISRVKNKRFLDARLHLIDEITSVDSFLVSNNLLNKSDARYFTSLYDNWQYGALYNRKSGHSFEIRFTPSYHWNYAKYNPEDTLSGSQLNENGLRGTLLVQYMFEKPINLNWQHSISLSLNTSTDFIHNLNQYGYSFNQNGIYSTNGFDTRPVTLNANYTLGFYPNTRTYLNAYASENYQLIYTKELNNNSSSWNKAEISGTSIGFNAYYYISPQVRLSVGAGIGYNTINYSTINQNSLSEGISGTLNYSIF